MLGSKSSPKTKTGVPKTIPLITLREGVIYPRTEVILAFGRTHSITGIKKALDNNRNICFVSQKRRKIESPLASDLHTVGTMCKIIKILPVNDELHALVRGLGRVKIHKVIKKTNGYSASVSEILDHYVESKELIALTNHAVNLMKKAVNLGKVNVDPNAFMKIVSLSSPIEISYQIASVLIIKNKQKQAIIEEDNLDKRLMNIITHLSDEIKVLQLEQKIASKTQKKFDKSMRETVLRERMRTIQRELGEGDDDDIAGLRRQIKKAKLPKDVNKKSLKELNRLAKMSIHSPEAGYIRTWIETVVELPWNNIEDGSFTLKKAEQILNRDHYGLEKVKERILEYIAVLKLKSKKKPLKKGQKKQDPSTLPTILCFVGPPGVGKTSVGKSIADALDRKFAKMSLGGVRDEAEIRGHRRTYVGAMPGRIIQSIKEAGTKNPVFMLDEVDKIGKDFRGDPSSALLEVLDPEQNATFRDHYIDMPFDLSQVLFITTANVLDTVPPALKDRLEVIQFTGYTEDEKYHIAKKYLVPKQVANHGLVSSDAKLFSPSLRYLINYYTREAGVRNLERQIASLLRKIARQKVDKVRSSTVNLDKKKINEFLGPEMFSPTLAVKDDQVGIVTGLAYTQAGGDILFIEVALMPGKGKIQLTGQLGDVMKESAQAAHSFVRSHCDQLGIDKKDIASSDVHIHVPEGAVPKDGPSAGLAITTALISAFCKCPVKKDLAMTGEITLTGRALEIGGVKEKVIAAHRAGIKEIILPKGNKKNLRDIPDKVKKDLKFHFVSEINDVIKIVFGSLGKRSGPKKK